jgi:hypothetical protein
LGVTLRSAVVIGALLLVQSHSIAQPDAQAVVSQSTVQSAAPDAPPAAAAAQAAEPAVTAAAENPEDVNVELEVVPAALDADSKVVVQLDNSEKPVPPSDATVSNLSPGLHTAKVIVLDGKDRPVHGGIATVHFRLHAKPGAGTVARVRGDEVKGAAPAPPEIPDELRDDADPHFSLRGSPLPLISLVGFALLIGGFLPPARARRASTRIVHP